MMTSSSAPPAPLLARRRDRRPYRLSGDGRAPLDLLPLEAESRPLGPGGSARQGAPSTADAEKPHLEQRILAFSLAHPGLGLLRISAEYDASGGGLRVSPNGVWRCLRRHGLNTRTRRLSLVAGYAARYERLSAGAPRRGAASGRARRARLLLRRAPEWDEGCCLAVHGYRRRLRLCMGGAAHIPAQPRPPSTARRSSSGSPPSSLLLAGGSRR